MRVGIRDFLIAQLGGAASVLLFAACAVLAFAAFVWAVKFAIYIWVR